MTLYEIREQLLAGKSIYDMPLRVTFYARVSTEKEEQINSLNNQIDYFRNFIRSNPNWTYVEGYVDSITGTSALKRDNFLKMVDNAKGYMFDLILTKEVSRFARDTLDSIGYTRKLLKYDVGIYFTSDNINTLEPDSELRLTIMSSIAQEEVRKISERTKFGFRRAVEKGRVLGTDNIWGYKKAKGKLVIDKEQAPMIQNIYEFYANDKKLGLLNLSAKLAKMGYLNSNGNPMQAATLKRIIENPKYKGYYTGGISTVVDYRSKKRHFNAKDDWTVYQDNESVPPIVSEELWERANKKLQERSKNSKGNPIYQNRYALSGKIYCQHHNIGYVRKVRKYKYRNDVIHWICQDFNKRGKKTCNSAMFLEKDLYQILFRVFQSYNKYKDSVCNELLEQYKKTLDSNANLDKIACIKNSIQKLEDKKAKLVDLALENVITTAELKEKTDKLNTEMNKLKSELEILIKATTERKNNTDYLSLLKVSVLENIDITLANIEQYIEKFVSKIIALDNDKSEIQIILNFNEIVKVTFEEHDVIINNNDNLIRLNAINYGGCNKNVKSIHLFNSQVLGRNKYVDRKLLDRQEILKFDKILYSIYFAI